jgi:ABC-type multidrug transport system fused ATPase/permease subunit
VGPGPASVRFDRLSVRGDNGEVVLDGVDLDIAPGSFVAIVGPTGAGKTTLVDCVLGLAAPTSGQVLIDSAPLRALSLSAWRRDVGYLGQDPVLFAGTVRDNVAWGRQIDDKAVTAALEMAGAGFVARLPANLDTSIAERRASFSGGERQRIALARALAGMPRLLVLDEATSAMDAETESAVAAAVGSRRGAVTILAVTHRPALVREADVVVVLEAGSIGECGTFSDLMVRGGRFAALWRAQNDAPARQGLPLVEAAR